jgi:hypothetical protein
MQTGTAYICGGLMWAGGLGEVTRVFGFGIPAEFLWYLSLK